MHRTLFELPLLIAGNVRCACSDATRIQIGPLSIPVGTVTVAFALIAALFLPAVIVGWLRRRREALEAAALLEGVGDRATRPPMHGPSVVKSLPPPT